MHAIIEAAKLQGTAKIERRAWAESSTEKTHLWELSEGGVIAIKQEGRRFKSPVKLNDSLDIIVERFRGKAGIRVFAPFAPR
jgi:hypothetical protein